MDFGLLYEKIQKEKEENLFERAYRGGQRRMGFNPYNPMRQHRSMRYSRYRDMPAASDPYYNTLNSMPVDNAGNLIQPNNYPQRPPLMQQLPSMQRRPMGQPNASPKQTIRQMPKPSSPIYHINGIPYARDNSLIGTTDPKTGMPVRERFSAGSQRRQSARIRAGVDPTYKNNSAYKMAMQSDDPNVAYLQKNAAEIKKDSEAEWNSNYAPRASSFSKSVRPGDDASMAAHRYWRSYNQNSPYSGGGETPSTTGTNMPIPAPGQLPGEAEDPTLNRPRWGQFPTMAPDDPRLSYLAKQPSMANDPDVYRFRTTRPDAYKRVVNAKKPTSRF